MLPMPLLIGMVLLGIFVIPITILLYFCFVRHKLATEHVRVFVDTSCSREKRNGLVIGHLSDFHYDFGLEERIDPILADALQALSIIRPDLILLTGDYINADPRPAERLCRQFVHKLQSMSALGVFATLGNHDTNGNEFIGRCLAEAGATVLRNQMVEVKEGVWICGLEDVWNTPGWRGHKQVMQQLHQKEHACLRIVMSHNPDTAQRLEQYNYDLQLSGHAHGGQICLPPFVKVPGYNEHYNVPVLGLLRPVFDWAIPRVPWFGKIFADWKRKQKYSYVIRQWDWCQGLHCINTDYRKHLYVTRGVGSHKNMRLFCPPELTFLTILEGRNSAEAILKKET